MSADHILTIGSSLQLPEVLKGPLLQGRGEPRIVMVGRSNVGKSSLINALVNAKVAQISKQPGKTRKIHFYFWKEGARIVADLPGYGYARAAASEQKEWEHFIADYLDADDGIERALVLLDSRHGPTPLDVGALSFLKSRGISPLLVFTKSDALKNQSERAIRRREASAALEELGFDPAEALWVSSRTGDGMKALIGQVLGRVAHGASPKKGATS